MDSNVQLIFGNDEYVVAAKADEIVKARVAAEDMALGLETVDGAAKDVEEAVQAVSQCLSAVLTRGMFGGSKVVWFRNVNFLTDTAVGRSATVKAQVNRLADVIHKGLDAATTLVISATGVDKRYTLFKACKKQGEFHEFAMPEKAHLADRMAGETLRTLLAARDLQLSAEARTMFMERVGNNTRQMVNELDKVCVFLGKRNRASADDIRAIVSLSRESPTWDLADAFGKRQLARALDLTRQLMFQKESPIRMVITIEGRIRDLMLYKEGLQRKWLEPGGRGRALWGRLPAEAEQVFAEELERDPRANHPFRVGLLTEQAAKFSRKELRACQEWALAAHEKLVSSSMPESVVLEIMLINMLS